MPTQEEINAANVELQIANDNYAALADRYNRYRRVFEAYANASPEVQEKARGAMENAIADYNQLRNNMLAAENRIAIAQNAVNNINSILAQPATTPAPAATKRRVIKETPQPKQEQHTFGINPTFDKLYLQQKVGFDNQYNKINPAPQQATMTAAPAVPYEVQRVQQMRGNDYLKGMKDLEENYGYRVFNQNAYRNGNKYSLN